MTEEKFENYMYINKLYLGLIGLWPNEKSDTVWLCYIYKFRLFAFPCFLWILQLLPMLLDLYIVWGNNYALFQNMCMTIHVLSVCLKYTHIATNQALFKVSTLYNIII